MYQAGKGRENGNSPKGRLLAGINLQRQGRRLISWKTISCGPLGSYRNLHAPHLTEFLVFSLTFLTPLLSQNHVLTEDETLWTQLGGDGAPGTPSPKLTLFSLFLPLAWPGPQCFSSHTETEWVVCPPAPVKMASSLSYTHTLAVPALKLLLLPSLHLETSAPTSVYVIAHVCLACCKWHLFPAASCSTLALTAVSFLWNAVSKRAGTTHLFVCAFILSRFQALGSKDLVANFYSSPSGTWPKAHLLTKSALPLSGEERWSWTMGPCLRLWKSAVLGIRMHLQSLSLD